MKSSAPVFIVGPSRSGTTLLYRILQKHSVFKPHNSPVGVDLTESQVFYSPESIYNKEKGQRVGAYSYVLCDSDLFDEFLGELRWTRIWQKLLGTRVLPGNYNFLTRRFLNYRMLRLIFWNLYRGPAMARAYFRVAMRARGVERILEKTPTHLHRIPEIVNTYPDARVVGIVRHPIDVFTSYKRRYEIEHRAGIATDELAWLKISPEQFCTRYKMDAELIKHRNGLGNSCFMYVSYEDLTNNPQETVRQLLTFLGESYEEQCVNLKETKRLHWNVDPHLFDEIQTKTKDWREYIKKEEAEYIELNLALPMKQLGYRRYT
jgi:hypothetical protein